MLLLKASALGKVKVKVKVLALYSFDSNLVRRLFHCRLNGATEALLISVGTGQMYFQSGSTLFVE